MGWETWCWRGPRECSTLKEAMLGKLWSFFFLVPLCPSQSLTSVAAMECLVASWPAKGQARPRRRDCEVIANRAEPGKIQKTIRSMPWPTERSLLSSGCRVST